VKGLLENGNSLELVKPMGFWFAYSTPSYWEIIKSPHALNLISEAGFYRFDSTINRVPQVIYFHETREFYKLEGVNYLFLVSGSSDDFLVFTKTHKKVVFKTIHPFELLF
jgi:hypothetical protein